MSDTQRAIAGLLAAIIAEPQRDDLRLIAADAYDDDAQFDRAAFIRCQVELAALPQASSVALTPGSELVISSPSEGRRHFRNNSSETTTLSFDSSYNDDPHREKRQKLKQQEFELLDKNYMKWSLTFPGPWTPHGCKMLECRVYFSDPNNTDFCQAVYHRGFIREVMLTAEDWLAQADAITAQQPIEEVSLKTLPEPANRSKWTTRSLLKHQWPRIIFHLPQNSAESEILEGLGDGLAFFPAAVAVEMQRAGIDTPCDMHRLRESALTSIICACSPHTVRGIAPTETTFNYQTISLNHLRYDDGNSNITDYYFGQCPRCRTIYWRSTTYGVSPIARAAREAPALARMQRR